MAKTLLTNCEENIVQKMTECDFIFAYVDRLYQECYKTRLERSGPYIDPQDHPEQVNNIRAMIEKRLIFHLIEKIEKKSERNTTSVALNIIFIDEKDKKEVEHNRELQQLYISK